MGEFGSIALVDPQYLLDVFFRIGKIFVLNQVVGNKPLW